MELLQFDLFFPEYRLDVLNLGPESANKTRAISVTAVLASWLFAFGKIRIGFWVFLGFSTVSFAALLQTGSRSGLVAVFVSFCIFGILVLL